ncbi:MAG TPA: CHASE2 domain-containing protein [Chroococcidiopsis sp.]
MNQRLRNYGWRLLPGGIATLAIAILFKLAALEPLEYVAYHQIFRLRGEKPWDDRIVLIAIDDVSLKRLGRFPLSRQHYVELFERLIDADPSIVVVNLLWSESSPEDRRLAAVMARYGRVVLAEAQDATRMPLLPVKPLRDVAIALGHILETPDSDNTVRHIIPLVGNRPALGVAAVESYSLVREAIPLPPLDRPLWVNWPGPASHLTHYSLVDVIQGRVPPAALRDKIVLVGVTATGIDPMRSPFDGSYTSSNVHLHAAVIHNLLQQTMLHPVGTGWLVLIWLLGGPGLSWLLSNWGTRKQLVGMVLLSMGWLLLSLIALQVNYWLPVASPILLFCTTAAAVALRERLHENQIVQQQIEQLWFTYRQDLVMQSGDSPKALVNLGGLEELPSSPSSLRQVNQLAALAEQFGRSQSSQAAIARSLSIGLSAFDLDGSVWFCNPVAAATLGLKIGEQIAHSLVPEWLDLAEWQANLHRLSQGQMTEPQEINRADRWYCLKLEPLSYRPPPPAQQSTAPDGALLLLEDITAQKQIEANLLRQVQELEQISYLKDDFLSTVSHELRAPMANMKMAIHMLAIAPSEQTRQQYLRILREECDREMSLISDLLDLQNLAAGSKPLQTEAIALDDWLPTVIEGFYSRAETRQQTLQLVMPPSLPVLYSDPSSLERLLTELLNNACKYTPPAGEIAIAVEVSPPMIELRVSNTGVEIAEQEQTRIFDKFYRIPSSDRWKQGGTGLGLALVKKLVEHLGGTIRVESQKELTQFRVQLPLRSADSP